MGSEDAPSSITNSNPAANPTPAEAAARADTTIADAPLTAPSTRPSTRPLTREQVSRSKARTAALHGKSARRQELGEPTESASTGDGKQIQLARRPPLDTPEQANQAVEHLMRAILNAAESIVPEARICQVSQASYTEELASLRAEVNQARRTPMGPHGR
ncbi:hypothetical protein CNMCM8980_001824 [Aspergillus fumigatiaffinis]|uniref:Uncharacterized protein n=1 Tax=Aspergillus fumigatiaffinis TaxID=340414 RepID=A0A8H4GRG0_9EURO|nr:hypothetical protein CNMCM5878_002203 [Aspergillus fumigatiaffinis]KAF4221119.1 hypothetical protein CNMCM6457_001956 [Aspergillus fumigatiaffinis]KAF4226854.1 hypothetical protein CNMCM6805_003977 [Aspergillus fumigatiaffinis]KAF4238998.1 hypothetical protein CNMCM8980_001824 [Aspergillus fumigatiaffinis]